MNSIEKKKTALIGLSIAILVLALLGLVGGVVLIVFGARNLGESNLVAGIIMLVIGVLLVIAGVIGVLFGIRNIWVGSALKATKGSIAEENLAKTSQSNTVVKCPKCGCTNSIENTNCSNCNEPLTK